MSVLHDVLGLGQSVWLDTISRRLLASGELEQWVRQGVTGMTTNPSIFEQAIANTEDYDAEIRDLTRQGRSPEAIYEALTLQEVRAAADILRPVYDRTEGVDGYVSLEVSPLLASDRETTVSEAKRLFAALERPNVMIKIPATPEGVEAVAECIAAGINVNSTLIFSGEQYRAVAEAYIRGSKARGGKAPASVASVFVSRVDTAVDKLLAGKGADDLMGHIAVDGIRLIYQDFKKLFPVAKGAQRPLWASTGTKNPAYSDVKYIQELIGPHTVNTVPPATLAAFLDHGRAEAALESGLEEGRARLGRLKGLGIDLPTVYAKLLADGLESFNGAFRSLIAAIAKKAAK